MEENKYRYADREEQLKKANSFLVLGFLVFYAFVMVVVVTACIRHIRTVGYTAMLSTIIVLSILVTVVMFLRNRKDNKIRYMAIVGLLVVTFLCPLHLTIIMCVLWLQFRLWQASFSLIQNLLQFQVP